LFIDDKNEEIWTYFIQLHALSQNWQLTELHIRKATTTTTTRFKIIVRLIDDQFYIERALKVLPKSKSLLALRAELLSKMGMNAIVI
jgi:hypothetical protein